MIPLLVVVAVTACMALVWLLADRIVAQAARVRPPTAQERERLSAYTESLCLSAGLPEPGLWVIDDPVPAALAWGRRRATGKAAVTTGLLEGFPPVEIEAVMAHLLCRIRAGAARRDTLTVVLKLVFYPIGAIIANRQAANQSAVIADGDAVRITRFPQALISALGKMEAGTEELRRKPGLIDRLWMHEPSPGTRMARTIPLSDRITYLADSGRADPLYVEPGGRILIHTPKTQQAGRTATREGE